MESNRNSRQFNNCHAPDKGTQGSTLMDGYMPGFYDEIESGLKGSDFEPFCPKSIEPSMSS